MSDSSSGFSESVSISSTGDGEGMTSHTEVVENGETVVDETHRTSSSSS